MGVAIGRDNSVYTTGDLSGTADFDPSSGVAPLTSNGGDDVFISKFESPASVSGRVWYDLNRDGIQGSNEVGQPGVSVQLFSSSDSLVGNADDASEEIISTDASGNYTFSGLVPRRFYYLHFSSPDGLVFTTQVSGNDSTRDSDADNTGRTAMFTLAVNQNRTSIDAGLVDGPANGSTLSVGNLVWNDLNSNGIQDPNEPGVAGATVEIFRSSNAVVNDSDDISLGVAITDPYGRYSHAGLVAGINYYLIFRTPVGYTFTTRAAGSDPVVDSDANATGSQTCLRWLQVKAEAILMQG